MPDDIQPAESRAPHIKPPGPVSFEKDSILNWKLWKQLWHHYTIVSGLGDQTEAYQKSFLISVMGLEALQLYNACDPADTDTAKIILEKLDMQILGETNDTFERYKFNTAVQGDESIDTYVAQLKELSKTCNFCDCIKESLLRDRIVIGVKDNEVRKSLLAERKLTLKKCIDICRSHVNTVSQLKVIAGKSDSEVHKVSKDHRRNVSRYDHRKYEHKKPPSQQTRDTDEILCKYCGIRHARTKEVCGAWGKSCHICKGRNHFARCCPKKNRRKVHGVYEERDYTSESDFEDVLSVSSVVHGVTTSAPLYAEMLVLDYNQGLVKFQIDCGATVNVISQKYVSPNMISPSDTKLRMYNNSVTQPVGKAKVMMRNPQNNKKYRVEFQVVRENLTPLLSRRAVEQMQLITVNYDNFKQVNALQTKSLESILEEYSEIFDNTKIGSFPGEVHLEVNKDVKPVQCPPRKVPIALKPKLKEELESLTNLGVLTPVTEPTKWCSQISIQRKKNGNMRICSDPRNLNESLTRELYPLPTIDDVLPELHKAKIFSVVDLAHGYWHCNLDDESSYLTAIVTPFGRYRWKRLPFGLNVSSEIFQRKLHECLEGLEGVRCIADDILVYSEDEMQHSDHLEKLFQRCQDKNIKLNKEKSIFKTDRVPFQGHVFTSNGLMVDEKKTEAIVNMSNPTDKEGVLRLQGTVNYLSKFLPQLSTVMEPIRRLSHQDSEWHWGEEQEHAMSEVKRLVTTAPVLAYYNPELDLIIQCDASSTGLGATLLQEDKPLVYASRSLSSTEQGYAQIEKECLAIVFSLQKFHQYTFGRKTIIHTDHKPLEAIVKKPLQKAPKRIQGMLLRILQYDTEVIYKRGKDLHIADMLSRAYLPLHSDKTDQFSAINAVSHLRISQERLEELRSATKSDETMEILKTVILKGWPENKADVPAQIAPYFSFRDEISVHDGLLFKGERVIVPSNMRADIKSRLHTSHLGIESMLRRARECVYWPSMTAEIKQVAESCETCQSFSRAQQKEPLMPIDVHSPWEKIGVDLCDFDNQTYMVTTDYFSGFWEIDKLNNNTSQTVINKLKHHFARFGIPSILISDNGGPFISHQFQQFSKEWDFTHQTCAPTHSNANGKAESGVKAAKSLLKKCKSSKCDPLLALLEIRNTPTQGAGTSPSQRLLNRRTRSILPMTDKMLTPRGEGYLKLDNMNIRKDQARQAKYYNKSAKQLPTLTEGDTVRMRPFRIGQKQWEKAVVSERLDERSYTVETPSGTFRRNRIDLKRTNEPPPETANAHNAESSHSSPDTTLNSPTLQASDIPVPTSAPTNDVISTPKSSHQLRRSRRRITAPEHFKDYKL